MCGILCICSLFNGENAGDANVQKIAVCLLFFCLWVVLIIINLLIYKFHVSMYVNVIFSFVHISCKFKINFFYLVDSIQEEFSNVLERRGPNSKGSVSVQLPNSWTANFLGTTLWLQGTYNNKWTEFLLYFFYLWQ